MSMRCDVSRLPAYIRYATSDSSSTSAQNAMVRNGRPGGDGSPGPRPPLSPRGPPRPRRSSSSPSLWKMFTRLCLLENAHVGQIPIALGGIHAVPDHKLVADRPSLVVHRDGDLPTGSLVEERRHLDARGPTGFEKIENELDTSPRIHHSLTQHHVTPADIGPQVHDQLHVTARDRARAIAGDRQEIHLDVERRGARQVHLEHARAFQDAHEQRAFASRQVPRQLEPQLAYALLDL